MSFATDDPGALDEAMELHRRARAQLDPELIDATQDYDVSALLPTLEVPALVFSRADIHRGSVESARDVARSLPDARYLTLAGDEDSDRTNNEELLEVIWPFVTGKKRPGSRSRSEVAVQTILFTDLEASTPLTQRLGDEGAQEILRGHNTTVRGALDEHGGREVKHTGDGIMASFPSAVAAVTAALQIQRELAGGEVRVRVGLNAGEPIAEDDDLFGLSVIKAARIADRAEPGQVLVSGPVLMLPPGGVTNLEWYTGDTDAHEKFCARLAEHRTLVLYDRHGYGLSDRDRTDFSFEDDERDLDAVIEAVGATTVDFFGISWGGGPTLAYAAAHPERVRKIVLYGTGSSGRAPPNDEFVATHRSLVALRRANRDLYNQTMALQYFPTGTDPETFASFGRMLGESATVEMVEALELLHPETQSKLSDIHTPALVLHRRGDQIAQFLWGQYLARRLPNARFVPLEGDVHFPWVGDVESVLTPTIEFLTADDPDATPTAERGLQVILFTDLAGSTAMQARLGDSAARA